MILIYRGEVFEYTPPMGQPYGKPRALNWRYQVSNETYNNDLFSTPAYIQPRAINWRYRVN